MTATGREPRTTQFLNEHSTIWSITGNTYNVGDGEGGCDANKVGKNETEVVTPLKHLSNFWRSLN